MFWLGKIFKRIQKLLVRFLVPARYGPKDHNVVIYNLNESHERNQWSRKRADKKLVSILLRTLKVNAKVVAVYRIGQRTVGLNRPLRLVTRSTEGAQKVLISFWRRRHHLPEQFASLVITEDLTQKQQIMLARLQSAKILKTVSHTCSHTLPSDAKGDNSFYKANLATNDQVKYIFCQRWMVAEKLDHLDKNMKKYNKPI